jgi:glycine/D-amino acid oxidase-like deaminating enzyme
VAYPGPGGGAALGTYGLKPAILDVRGVPTGDVSYWHAALGGPPPRRASLPGSTEADVCIVGAGYTGLWTAWALASARPDLRIVIVEAAHVGFGASGRNGGWLSGLLPGDRALWAAGPRGRDGVVALQRALNAAVDDVLGVCAAEGIEADAVKGGTLAVATSAAQVSRLHASFEADQEWGVGPDDAWMLSAAEVAARVRVAGAQAGVFNPNCARIQPAKLVRGLADAVERRGVTIFESTPATSIEPHLVRTDFGDISAKWVVRATEGFTSGLPGYGRSLLPMNSSMVVTSPLSDAAWDEIGWSGMETLRDEAHVYAYAQRTADGRIALGGRGIPYRWGSRLDHRGETDAGTAEALAATVRRLFPAAGSVRLAHSWCGVLGVARDWCPSVGLDPATGIGWAGGYVGDGVTASHLAGRTLADLILGQDSELVTLPWVGHRSRHWEPEPLRWAGVKSIYALYRAADRAESGPSTAPANGGGSGTTGRAGGAGGIGGVGAAGRSGRAGGASGGSDGASEVGASAGSRWAWLADRISGRP